MKKWIAFFSYTGTDIYNVSSRLGRFPDMIISNNKPDSVNEDLISSTKNITFIQKAPDSQLYRRILGPANCLVSSNIIVTLHGWMRIVPPDICEEYEIYNLHPGLISKYPELKGKDPQLKAYSSLDPIYDDVGVVIHKATEELDGGEIVVEKSIPNTFTSFKQMDSKLHRMGTDAWVSILPGLLSPTTEGTDS
jgi:folate-dependent phosphoribosylglycinamide formyltransferase PurN